VVTGYLLAGELGGARYSYRIYGLTGNTRPIRNDFVKHIFLIELEGNDSGCLASSA
jgi:hypothetical protein